MPKPPPRKPRRPEYGYSPVDVVDAICRDEPTTCDLCSRKLRWVHVIAHSALDHYLSVGCCCAARMCDDYDAVGAETCAKNRAARLRSFIAGSNWRQNDKGNLTRKLRDKTYLTVFPGRWGGWSYSIKKPKSQVKFSTGRYSTTYEAMAAMFAEIDTKPAFSTN